MACIHDVVPPEFKQVPLIFLYRSFKSFLVFGCIVAPFKHQVKKCRKAGIIHPLCKLLFMGLVEAISAEHCVDPRRLNPILPVQLQPQGSMALKSHPDAP